MLQKRLKQEQERQSWARGVVQTEEKQQKQEELLKEKKLTIYKDDEELNTEMKNKSRWNDPSSSHITVIAYYQLFRKKVLGWFTLLTPALDPHLIDLILSQVIDGMERTDLMDSRKNGSKQNIPWLIERRKIMHGEQRTCK